MSLNLWEIWDRHHCEGSTALCEQLSMLSRPCSTTRWWQSLEDSDPLFKWSICQSYCWVDNSRQSGRILFFILVNIAYSCLGYQCDWTSKTLSNFLDAAWRPQGLWHPSQNSAYRAYHEDVQRPSCNLAGWYESKPSHTCSSDSP